MRSNLQKSILTSVFVGSNDSSLKCLPSRSTKNRNHLVSPESQLLTFFAYHLIASTACRRDDNNNNRTEQNRTERTLSRWWVIEEMRLRTCRNPFNLSAIKSVMRSRGAGEEEFPLSMYLTIFARTSTVAGLIETWKREILAAYVMRTRWRS